MASGAPYGVAAEDRGEVEAEAVDVVVGRPVAQAVEHQVAHDRVVAVQRVAGAAEVVVVALRREHVVGLVVDAPEGDVRAALVALRRCG